VKSLKQKIRIGHSPDSDDAFMFWGLASGIVSSPLEFKHVLHDIQTLNELAKDGVLETTAISVHAYAYVSGKYAILKHGGSFGEGYGPIIVANEPIALSDLKRMTIAVPGTLTSAFLQLSLLISDPKYAVVDFDRILPAVKRKDYKAGLLIHEGQITWQQHGLHLVVDLGKWWKEQTGLPLPLGVNVVRKDLGKETIQEINRALRESIHAAFHNREEALRYALRFGRGIDNETAERFVGMYVNERTLDMGEEGIRAIRLLLEKGAEAGLIPTVELDIVDL